MAYRVELVNKSEHDSTFTSHLPLFCHLELLELGLVPHLPVSVPQLQHRLPLEAVLSEHRLPCLLPRQLFLLTQHSRGPAILAAYTGWEDYHAHVHVLVTRAGTVGH